MNYDGSMYCTFLGQSYHNDEELDVSQHLLKSLLCGVCFVFFFYLYVVVAVVVVVVVET